MFEKIEKEIAHLETLENHPSEVISYAVSMAKKAAIARRNDDKTKTFDWMKAVSILKANNIKSADAGLIEDWHATAGTIVENGRIYKADYCNPYLHSFWATPGIYIERDDGTEEMIECWCYAENAAWDLDDIWPQVAAEEYANRPHHVRDEHGNEIEIW
ncbi:hypothetical protein OHX09_15125 [Acinetobacter baumannii]|nr:hypothetical protein [Acinetobacter baumannii]